MQTIVSKIKALIWRIYRRINKEIIHLVLPLTHKVNQQGISLKRYGSGYGGWTIPENQLSEQSVCYCVGVGVDASFDFELVKNFNCQVFSFDPTPLAEKYMQESVYDREKLSFSAIGVWDKNTKLKLYFPANSTHTSSSVYDLHGTNRYIEAECKTLSTIMSENGHKKLDLLKLDIEGAWMNVLKSMIHDEIDVSIVCVELDSPVTISKVYFVIRALAERGLVLTHYEKDNYLFVKQ